ncbi:MAG: acylneuraminate cytidylyltransferase family protein [Sulfurimonas sp.]|nr:acylneuraminate cytidylyltransferase family protein [Sulfurimonas sp.]
MLNKNAYLAVIPARGGSKRLAKKNILTLKGKPLIAYTIEAGLESQYIDKLIVSSDNDEILSIAKEYDIESLKRPDELASNTATTVDVLLHAIASIPQEYTHLVLLQATSPLRTSKHIDEAIELFEHKSADGVISVVELEHSPLWSNTLPQDLSMKNFISQDVLNKRSQDLESYYRLNGAIYIVNIQKFLKEKSFFLQENSYAYVMDKLSSVDIDEAIDFMLAEVALNYIKKKD